MPSEPRFFTGLFMIFNCLFFLRFVKRLPKESKGKKFFNSLREKMKWGKGKGEKRDEKAEVPESVDPPNTTSGECRS